MDREPNLQQLTYWLIQNSRQSDKLSVFIISQQQSDIFSSIYYMHFFISQIYMQFDNG